LKTHGDAYQAGVRIDWGNHQKHTRLCSLRENPPSLGHPPERALHVSNQPFN
jgi:hypothetical protein